MKGKFKWYNRVKGYGFIVPDDGGPEIFVHYTDIPGGQVLRRKIQGTEAVEFERKDGAKGPVAVDVRVVPA